MFIAAQNVVVKNEDVICPSEFYSFLVKRGAKTSTFAHYALVE
jgi:hypothetical protein